MKKIFLKFCCGPTPLSIPDELPLSVPCALTFHWALLSPGSCIFLCGACNVCRVLIQYLLFHPSLCGSF